MQDLPGTQDSLWMATSARRPRPALVGDAGHVDVAVVGAGITGLTTALLCKREGLRVAVLEMGEVCQGVTGYTTAKVSALHEVVYATLLDDLGEERARAYADANAAAVEGIAQLVSELAIECAFERRPALTWTEDPDQVDTLRREADAAAQLGLPARFTDATDLPFPVAGAVVLPDQAQFHPRDYVLGLADAVHGDGCVVAERCRVLDVDAGSPHRVDYEGGELLADHVVLATHMPFLDRGGLFAKAHPSRSYCLSAVVDGPVPESMAINVESPTRSVRSYSREGVPRIVVSGGVGHKPGDDPHEPRQWADLLEWAHAHFRVTAVDYRWSAQDYVSVDGMPYIGRLSRSDDRLWTATGYRKWGMTNGTAAARILTDGILGRDNAWAEAFSPNRVTAAASAATFVKENVAVAAHFVGDRLGLPGAEAVDDLADGDGVVCRVGGEAYAVSRQGGAMRAVSPVCTHMGCHVAWNAGEGSWDCPCHGSRFAPDGTVIQGPATTDLAGMDLPADE
jgi:glycine/D-amino acid oxidase-like deaminating enzyme/nitrite reductase/ring-hydroxylating ferredoxin subunit